MSKEGITARTSSKAKIKMNVHKLPLVGVMCCKAIFDCWFPLLASGFPITLTPFGLLKEEYLHSKRSNPDCLPLFKGSIVGVKVEEEDLYSSRSGEFGASLHR